MSDHFQKGLLYGVALVGVTVGTLYAVTALTSMNHPPVISVQRGFRGTGLDQLYTPATLAALAVQAKVPRSLPPASPAGVKASVAYKNVHVLGYLSTSQFTRLMVSITGWVAPKQGCAYCHNVANMADDSNYTKVVARRMMQMTQNINGNWQAHVQNVGVTCYTCHGGNPVPKNIWFNNPGGPTASGQAETQTGMAHPTKLINYSSLPYDPFTPYLEQANNIRVQSETALPQDNMSSIKGTEWTYALMIHFSQSLGVNCDYCHNTRAFANWAQSTPARVTAWYGIRMVRDLNNHYLDPLNGVFPDYRKGQLGDSPKVYCATCHQGIYKPLYGVSMLTTFKTELGGPPLTTAAYKEPAGYPKNATASDRDATENSPLTPPGAVPAGLTAPPADAAPPPAPAPDAAPAPTPGAAPAPDAAPAPAPTPDATPPK
jgi:photosynthetic reaction center cytochrome c subunit